MFYFPRPYPDEVIDSLLVRACRHTGLPKKRLIAELTHDRRDEGAFSLCPFLIELGRVTAVDPEALLIQHTLFPYAVAFMNRQDATRIKDALLTVRRAHERSVASCTQSATRGVVYRRYCPVCGGEDLLRYGESYWHREHLLPATYVCSRHRTPLVETAIPVQYLRRHVTYELPNETPGRPQNLPTPQHLLESLAIRSSALLSSDTHRASDVISIYRSNAIAKGYGLAGNFIAGRQLASDLQAEFGTKLLKHAGCCYGKTAWPALMLRERVSVRFAPVKHVLLEVFLDSTSSGQKHLAYNHPGPTPRKRADQDKAFLKNIKTVLSRSPGKRYSIRDLLTDAGCWATFRHSRNLFPETAHFVNNFRHSSRSVKPIKG